MKAKVASIHIDNDGIDNRVNCTIALNFVGDRSMESVEVYGKIITLFPEVKAAFERYGEALFKFRDMIDVEVDIKRK